MLFNYVHLPPMIVFEPRSTHINCLHQPPPHDYMRIMVEIYRYLARVLLVTSHPTNLQLMPCFSRPGWISICHKLWPKLVLHKLLPSKQVYLARIMIPQKCELWRNSCRGVCSWKSHACKIAILYV